jgi:acetolactate synthase-1/2/3 large subunit
MRKQTYADQLVGWLAEEGYTHCFFLAGGNIMHLLDAVRTRMVCVPFVHEVGAAIATEYFTALRKEGSGKAFALVTAGPGLTNTVTAIASAYTESRELLVIGGQVKSADLSRGRLRQRGIQEIDGPALVSSICKTTLQLDSPIDKVQFLKAVRHGSEGRKGPVFIEVCLDTQGAEPVAEDDELVEVQSPIIPKQEDLDSLQELLIASKRPVLLLGGGLSRTITRQSLDDLSAFGVPIMTTWNGADLIPSDNEMYFGRPNTWGQRYSNVLIQQADLVIAIGTRLGIQQTGFASDQFVPNGKIVQVDIDEAELEKGHPRITLAIKGDANLLLQSLLLMKTSSEDVSGWTEFARDVKQKLPLQETTNTTGEEYVSPHVILKELTQVAGDDSIIIPCSSGGAFTVSYQTLEQKGDQRLLSNKSMASMGYGLSGAIGASLAHPHKTTYLIEGDGGFAQNLQELGTLVANNLPVKILLFVNNGYASIRMTQRNYFNGAWIGCDTDTGVGFPNWAQLSVAFGVPYARMNHENFSSKEVRRLISSPGPALIEVPIDPEQTYFPKIASKVQTDGSMRSDPLHLMQPALNKDLAKVVFKYLAEAQF